MTSKPSSGITVVKQGSSKTKKSGKKLPKGVKVVNAADYMADDGSGYVFDKDNTELLHLNRKKYKFNGRLIFEWEQTLEDVNIWIKTPKGIHAKHLDIKLTSRGMSVGLKNKQPFINDSFAHAINTANTTWFMDDDELTITLGKLEIGDTWNRVLKKQKKLNMFEEERMKKSMLLERFARENPGMDFSNAKFDGQCPEPNKFIDGIDTNRFHT